MMSTITVIRHGEISQSDSILRCRQAYNLIRPFGSQSPELNDQFENLAKSFSLLSQREADEQQAGRVLWRPQECRERFDEERAIEHINWTIRTKGELSGDNVKVMVDGPRKSELAFYTQTREYHITGGEELVRMADNTYGWERVRFPHGEPPIHVESIRRARILRSMLDQIRQGVGTREEARSAAALDPPPGHLPGPRGTYGIPQRSSSAQTQRLVKGPILGLDNGIWESREDSLDAVLPTSTWPSFSEPRKRGDWQLAATNIERNNTDDARFGDGVIFFQRPDQCSRCFC